MDNKIVIPGMKKSSLSWRAKDKIISHTDSLFSSSIWMYMYVQFVPRKMNYIFLENHSKPKENPSRIHTLLKTIILFFHKQIMTPKLVWKENELRVTCHVYITYVSALFFYVQVNLFPPYLVTNSLIWSKSKCGKESPDCLRSFVNNRFIAYIW